MASTLDPVLARWRTSGGRITKPRIGVVQALRDHSSPATTEELLLWLRKRQIACDLVSVYRILAKMEDEGLVSRLYTHNGCMTFALADDSPRCYVMTREDGGPVEVIDGVLAAEISKATSNIQAELARRGFSNVSSVVQFFAEAPAGEKLQPAQKRS